MSARGGLGFSPAVMALGATALLLAAGKARAHDQDPPPVVLPPATVAPADISPVAPAFPEAPPAVPEGSAMAPPAPTPLAEPSTLVAVSSPAPVDRPRLSLALGMGVSFDDTGLSPRRTAAIPSFFAVGGFGDGFVGIDFGVFATTATGRFRPPDVPVDRLAVDAMLVLRPLCHGIGPEETAWRWRLLRTLAVEAGTGYERDGRGVSAEQRVGWRLGGRIELPLTSAADSSQLRLRLAARRLFAGTKAGSGAEAPVRDSVLELYGALAVVF